MEHWHPYIAGVLFINLLFLMGALMFGYSAYTNLRDHTESLTEITNIFLNTDSSSSTSAPSPVAVKAVSRVIRAVVDDFFFGDANGDIPDFVIGLLSYNFAGLASTVSSIAESVQEAFMNQPTTCGATLTCTRGNVYAQCPNGNVVFCPSKGAVVACSSETCLAPTAVTVASVVNSVMMKLETLPPLSGSMQGTPAFSDGLLRLDLMLQWVQSQTTVTDWSNAAVLCQNMTQNLGKVQWMGGYVNLDGTMGTWDARPIMHTVLDYAGQACNGIAQLSAKAKKTKKN